MFDKKGVLSAWASLAVVGGAVCLELSVRKAGTAALRVGDSTILVGAAAGTLVTLLELESDEIEAERATMERLERKLCAVSVSGEVGMASPAAFFLVEGVLRERKLEGKGMW